MVENETLKKLIWMPPKVREQLEAFEARTDSPDRIECERLYPDLLRYLRSRISLIDIIRDSGYQVKPLSRDTPSIYVAKSACPCCEDDVFLRG